MTHNPDAVAEINLVDYNKTSAIITADMSDVLDTYANEAERGFMLTDDRQSLVVRDEISLKSISEPISWNLLMGGQYQFPKGNNSTVKINDIFTVTGDLGNGLIITHNRTGRQMKLDFVIDVKQMPYSHVIGDAMRVKQVLMNIFSNLVN